MSKILFLAQENKIPFFKAPCNVLFIIEVRVFYWKIPVKHCIYIINAYMCIFIFICVYIKTATSKTSFNKPVTQLLTLIRLNDRNHIKRGFSGCQLSKHFLHNSRTHNFDRDTKITIIKEIKWHEMHIERKKEILCRREVFWQKKLIMLQPNGLNKRMG